MPVSGGNIACTLKCCLCGVDIPGDGARMCNKCLIANTNISEGIETNAEITYCKECRKVRTSTKHWVYVERESIEELGIMLKMIKGLKKNELAEARFIWTEPHSQRIILELSIRKDIDNGLSVIGKVPVTFKVHTEMCPDCQRVATDFTWEAVVQIRQRADHKRTLLWLEQHLINTRRHTSSMGFQIVGGGFDFYFAKKNDAIHFVDYLKTIIICNQKTSKQFHGADEKNHVAFYRYTYYLEVPSVCKDDLCLLPRSLAKNMSVPLVLCTKVTTSLNFVHPITANTTSVNALAFNKTPFSPIMTTKHLKEFTVLDVQLDDRSRTRSDEDQFAMADIEVIRSDEFGISDDSVIVRSHLGLMLNPGDLVMGYDLRSYSLNNSELEKYDLDDLPDVILVTKAKDPEKKKKKKKSKKVVLKEVKETEEVNEKEVEQYEKDREEYLQEEDEEDFEVIDEEDYEVVA